MIVRLRMLDGSEREHNIKELKDHLYIPFIEHGDLYVRKFEKRTLLYSDRTEIMYVEIRE